MAGLTPIFNRCIFLYENLDINSQDTYKRIIVNPILKKNIDIAYIAKDCNLTLVLLFFKATVRSVHISSLEIENKVPTLWSAINKNHEEFFYKQALSSDVYDHNKKFEAKYSEDLENARKAGFSQFFTRLSKKKNTEIKNLKKDKKQPEDPNLKSTKLRSSLNRTNISELKIQKNTTENKEVRVNKRNEKEKKKNKKLSENKKLQENSKYEEEQLPIVCNQECAEMQKGFIQMQMKISELEKQLNLVKKLQNENTLKRYKVSKNVFDLDLGLILPKKRHHK